jgi:periplasmic divalent cation tolerance protein
MVFIHTTCATEEEAENLSNLIISKEIGACVHYWPIKSMYNWKGELKKTEEIMMVIVTFEPKLEEINDLISQHHSYSTPMIAGVDVRRINRAYKEWMMEKIV